MRTWANNSLEWFWIAILLAVWILLIGALGYAAFLTALRSPRWRDHVGPIHWHRHAKKA
jgi:hypothetical protein